MTDKRGLMTGKPNYDALETFLNQNGVQIRYDKEDQGHKHVWMWKAKIDGIPTVQECLTREDAFIQALTWVLNRNKAAQS